MRARSLFVWAVCAIAAGAAPMVDGQNRDRRQLERLEQAVEQEGRAVIALADARDDEPPADFPIAWRNDFLKAQSGTFVPFVVRIDAQDTDASAAALLYVRVARRAGDDGRRRRAASESAYPFEEIYPIELAPRSRDGAVRIVRGFSVEPGDYELTVVLRERATGDRRRRPRATVLRRAISVPDFSGPELTTSTVILADRVDIPAGAAAVDQAERPYVIGGREILPAEDADFRRGEELIVVFLVYNPSVTREKQFDLEVEYHFFRKSRDDSGAQPVAKGGRPLPAAQPGEIYVNRTEPQRFNPAVLGSQFEPAAGQPVLAGQGIPLAGFQEGDYRLAIRVTDRVSGRAIERNVLFSVHS